MQTERIMQMVNSRAHTEEVGEKSKIILEVLK